MRAGERKKEISCASILRFTTSVTTIVSLKPGHQNSVWFSFMGVRCHLSLSHAHELGAGSKAEQLGLNTKWRCWYHW